MSDDFDFSPRRDFAFLDHFNTSTRGREGGGLGGGGIRVEFVQQPYIIQDKHAQKPLSPLLLRSMILRSKRHGETSYRATFRNASVSVRPCSTVEPGPKTKVMYPQVGSSE